MKLSLALPLVTLSRLLAPAAAAQCTDEVVHVTLDAGTTEATIYTGLPVFYKLFGTNPLGTSPKAFSTSAADPSLCGIRLVFLTGDVDGNGLLEVVTLQGSNGTGRSAFLLNMLGQ